MRLHNSIIALIFALFASFSMFAQQDTQDTIPAELNKTIIVQSDPTVQLSDVVRISVNPKAYDTLDIQVDLKYSINTKPVETAYQLIPLKAVSVKGDKLQELYKGQATIGFGNYTSSLVNLQYMTERSRIKQAGVEFYHNSSSGKVHLANDEKVPAGFSTDYFNVYGKKFYDNVIVNASFKPQYKSVLKYGRETDTLMYAGLVPDTIYDKKDIRKNIFSTTTQIGIHTKTTDNSLFRYNSKLQHDLTIVNPKSIENLVDYSFSAKKQLDQIKTGLGFDVNWSGLNYKPLDTLLTKNAVMLRLLPSIGTTVDNWTLHVGINAMNYFGLNRFKAYPDVKFEYSLPRYSIIPFVRYSGNLQEISMKDMLLDNPYTTDYVMLRPTNNKMDLHLGVRGRLFKSYPYLLSCTFAQIEDMYLWVNDSLTTNNTMNSFTAIYDNASLFKIHAEGGVKRKSFDLNAACNVYAYTMDAEQYAWQKPGIDAQLTLKYNIISPLSNKNKLVLSSQLFYEDLIYAKDINGNAKKMNSIFDINLGIDYYYNSLFVIFIDVNNITATKYQKYYLYPSQRTNCMFGVSYSFAGRKE